MATTPSYLLDNTNTPPNQVQNTGAQATVPTGVQINNANVAANVAANRKYTVTGALVSQPTNSSTQTNNQPVTPPAPTPPISSQIPNTQNNSTNNPNTPVSTSSTANNPIKSTIPANNSNGIDTSITDLSKINTAIINPNNFKYGQDASASGINMPQRNYQLGAYYANKGMKDVTSIYNDLNSNPAYAKASEQDKQTTAQNIADQANKFTNSTSTAGTTSTTDGSNNTIDNSPAAIALREISNLNLATGNALKGTLQTSIDQQAKANLEKDKWANFDDLSAINNNVLNQFTLGRKDLLTKGQTAQAGQPPTAAEIQNIANNLGYTPDQVKSALNGTIWQGLQPNGNQADTLKHDRFVEDQNTQKDRAIEDLSDNLRITTQNINNQIDDVARQAQRTAQSTAVAGGLSGAIQSNGFAAGLQNIKDDANRTIGRLNQQLDDINHADVKDRTRLIDDFNKNISRAKTDYDTQMQTLKQNLGVSVTGIQNQYSLGSDTMTKTLNDLMANQQVQTNSIMSNYYDALKKSNDSLYYKSDALLDYQKKQADVQKAQADNLFRDNGIVLDGMTTTQLQKMVTDGTISQQTYDSAVAAQVGKSVATLQSMGNVTDADAQKIEAGIKSGNMTPAEARGAVINDGTNRFQNLAQLYKAAQINSANALTQQRLATAAGKSSGYSAVQTGNLATSAMTVPDGTDGGQCVQFISGLLKVNGQINPFLGGDQSLQSKIANVNSTVPTVGSIVVRQTNTPDGQKYGDVAMVVGVNGNQITIKGSNGGLNPDGTPDGKVYTTTIDGTVNQSGLGVKGYYDPAKVSDVDKIAYGIMNGDTPPKLTGLYKNTAAVESALASKGYNLTQANEDWTATQKYLSTLNGPAQTKLRQSIKQVTEQLPLIDQLNADAEATASKSGMTRPFSTSEKALALNGNFGPEAKTAFTKLESQTAELVSEMAAVYQGGNSATEKSLEEASKQLNTNWDYNTFKNNIDLIKKNIVIRNNSLNVGVAGTDNNYLPDTSSSNSNTPAPSSQGVGDNNTTTIAQPSGGLTIQNSPFKK